MAQRPEDLPIQQEQQGFLPAIPVYLPDINDIVDNLSACEDKPRIKKELHDSIDIGFRLLGETNVQEYLKENVFRGHSFFRFDGNVIPYPELDKKGQTQQKFETLTTLTLISDLGWPDGNKKYAYIGIGSIDNKSLGVFFLRSNTLPSHDPSDLLSAHDWVAKNTFAALRDVRTEENKLRLLACVGNRLYQDDKALEALQEESREQLDEQLFPVGGIAFNVPITKTIFQA